MYRKLKNSYENTENKKINHRISAGFYFHQYIQRLKKELQKTLPGKTAQHKMAPSQRIDKMVSTSSQNAGVLILLYPKNAEIYTTLIKRPVYKGVHSGQVSLPGGKFEEDKDISIVETAFRETQEEIGVLKNSISLVGKLTPLYIPVSDIHVQPVIGCLSQEPQFTADAREVDKIYKINIQELLTPECIDEDEIIMSDRKVTAPYYKFNHLQIWGATAMILSEYFEIHHKIIMNPHQ